MAEPVEKRLNPLTVRLTDTEHANLEKIARREKKSKSDLIRCWLEKNFQRLGCSDKITLETFKD